MHELEIGPYHPIGIFLEAAFAAPHDCASILLFVSLLAHLSAVRVIAKITNAQ